MFLLFIFQLFFLIWRMCFLFNHYVFCFFSIYFFFSFLCHWVSHHIPKRERKKTKSRNPKSRSKSVEACLPNTCLPNKCVCPLVCPTASHSFWCVVCPIFFLSSKLRCFTWNFGSWLVSPKNQDKFLFLQIHQHSEQNVKLEITRKVCKVWLINVLYPKNLEQKEIDGKNFARVPPRGPFPLW